MGELSAIIGTLSAMDWNDCPRSIGIPVRNRRNPHAIPPRQPLLPDPRDLIGVPAYSSKVAGYAVVGIVPRHHRSQMDARVGDGLMPFDPTPSRNRRQRAGVPVLCRYLPHHILTQPRLTPDV